MFQKKKPKILRNKFNDKNTKRKKKEQVLKFINTLEMYRIRAKTVCVNKYPCLTYSTVDSNDTIHCFGFYVVGALLSCYSSLAVSVCLCLCLCVNI